MSNPVLLPLDSRRMISFVKEFVFSFAVSSFVV
jgi:hypothetical protein